MAAMRAVDPRVSFAEMQQWPDDGRRYELYDGEVIVVPSPIPRHQRVVANIVEILKAYERATAGLVFFAPLDIVLTEYDVVQPDVVFFRHERRHVIDMMQPTRAVPDLAVEVLSRTTEARDRGRKLRLLARFCLPEYWLVDPVVNVLEVFTNVDGSLALAGSHDEGQPLDSPTLPGLVIPTDRVFAD
jgi:Uma2 family endonuclease